MNDKNIKVRTIAIRFSDNDFAATFLNALTHLGHFYDENPEKDWAKQELIRILKELSCATYVLWQNQFRYPGEKWNPEFQPIWSGAFQKTKEYIHQKLTEDTVLIDEEAADYICNTDWDNGETFYLIWTPSKFEVGTI